MKKPFILFFALFFCVLSGACLTSKLWKDNQKAGFKESISSFLITPTQDKLIVIGEKYHYILPLSADLKDILAWTGRKNLSADFSLFTIHKNNTIDGRYDLTYTKTSPMTEEDKHFLITHQFKSDTPNDNSYGYWKYTSKLDNGTVFRVGDIKIPAKMNFNQPYKVSVIYDYADSNSTIESMLLTPITVVGDAAVIAVSGAFLGVAVVLLPFSIAADKLQSKPAK